MDNFENEIIFERQNKEEPSLVVEAPDLEKISHPKITEILKKIGLTPDQLREYLSLDIKAQPNFSNHPVYNDDGKKIEDIDQVIVNTPSGPLDILDVVLHPEVLSAAGDTVIHLKKGQNGGFEIIYAKKGVATLSFTDEVVPAGNLYAGSKDKTDIELKPGTLAIIPAPTANSWTSVGEGFSFRYICQPPWNKDFVAPVVSI